HRIYCVGTSRIVIIQLYWPDSNHLFPSSQAQFILSMCYCLCISIHHIFNHAYLVKLLNLLESSFILTYSIPNFLDSDITTKLIPDLKTIRYGLGWIVHLHLYPSTSWISMPSVRLCPKKR